MLEEWVAFAAEQLRPVLCNDVPEIIENKEAG
jgi:hypothetical protein